jgi:hypothetical protein
MAKYGVEITEEFVIEMDFPPGAPTPRGLELRFEASTEEELRELVPALGFDAAQLAPTSEHHWRYLSVTRDGETVGTAQVMLHLDRSLRSAEPRPVPALERLREEAIEAQRAAAAAEHAEDAASWARSVGRPVEHDGAGGIREVPR